MSIRIATKAARESIFRRARVGAVIAKGERILSTGHNYIGYTKWIKRPYKESVHAEQAAILRLLKDRRLNDLAGATIYVSRIGRDGCIRLSYPCSNCQRLIQSVGITEVVYTTNNGVESYVV